MLLSAMAVSTATGCGPGRSDDLPGPPAGAVDYRGNASTTAAQLAMTDLRQRLEASYPDGQWAISRYSADPTTPWEQVRGHYADALGPSWASQPRYDGEATGYRSAAWRKGDHVVAIAWQPPSPPDTQPVLTVFLPRP